ncbi:MAG: zinc-binding alcohol dehydrogenase family protein [Candidatus Hydrogenedentota bacterium]
MKRVVVTKYGGPEVIQLQDAPEPQPGQGEVLVRVQAAGLNYADIMQREGYYLGGPTPPFGAGFEIAGTIEGLGEGVTEWREGDGVMGFCSNGFSEWVTVPAANLLQKPDSLDFTQAAAIPVQYFTAYHALCTLANIRAGQVVLIHAAAGGLGTMLVQIAKLRDAMVIGTASSDEKCALIRELGCDYPINYAKTDFEAEAGSITGNKGCDLIIESVGGEVFDKSLRCMKTRGWMIVLGIASGQVRQVDTSHMLFHNLTVSGFHLMAYTQDKEAMEAGGADLHAWLASGALKVIVGHTFPFEQTAEAQKQMAARQTSGKVVLTPG